MQIVLHLFPDSPIYLEFSYYPKLAAAIYQVLSASDKTFATNLHHGEAFQNRIKLFGFSPLHSRQTEIHHRVKKQNKSGGLVFKGPCTFHICSPWPEIMKCLMDGFAKAPILRIGCQLVMVKQAVFQQPPSFSKKMVWRLLKPSSCITSWSCPNQKKKQYALPGMPVCAQSCEKLLQQNLFHKWQRLKDVRPDIAAAWLKQDTGSKTADFSLDDIAISLLPLSGDRNCHRKRHAIKKTSVFSWIAPIKIIAPKTLQRLAWSCGLGEMNSMGFGVVKEAIK
ncbi:MAG: CRISPR-associated endoribonuclease Cas6 [Desulfobacteraceae bacterium]|jgi:CRISPR-associated endoribonuclease Cas6